ncbi:hypothetical protein GCM10012275_59150 [Longimycelium tulufanense]|uniref:Lasso peptide biosynthesis PqqD family chaperone n=1 Tax=Longimycelium tulufanense TaxID=907463 RepID=A0A8J3CE27_9PSEU|nr:lasso peptide biosynthesis PqqD family chaperone [Longimycelium tulufanense]GGM80653.1 hypothetical protein GCM10012275_59150 [Longimycelium tulufanense]
MPFTLRRDVSMTTADDATVLLDERTGTYWQLNPSGSLVLSTLLSGGSPQQATEQLVERYAVEPARAADDVTSLVEHLRRAKLVTV